MRKIIMLRVTKKSLTSALEDFFQDSEGWKDKAVHFSSPFSECKDLARLLISSFQIEIKEE